MGTESLLRVPRPKLNSVQRGMSVWGEKKRVNWREGKQNRPASFSGEGVVHLAPGIAELQGRELFDYFRGGEGTESGQGEVPSFRGNV